MRVARDRSRSGAILYDDPAVSVTASVLAAGSAGARAMPDTIVAAGRITVTRYIRGGGATLLRWRVPPVPTVCTAAAMGSARPVAPLPIVDGAVVRHDGRTGAQLLAHARCDVVTLAATVRAGADAVTREYDRVSGRFARMATNDEGAARAQLLLSLLRASDHGGADAAFDDVTRDTAFFLRWSAMREWLASGSCAARVRLEEMARFDPHPEVRAAAAATLRALMRRAA